MSSMWVGELVGHGGEDLVLPGLLVLAGQEGGKGAVVQYDVPPQHVVAVLPHNVHLSRGKLRVGEGLLLQLDAPVQFLKKRVREFLGDLLQPSPPWSHSWAPYRPPPVSSCSGAAIIPRRAGYCQPKTPKHSSPSRALIPMTTGTLCFPFRSNTRSSTPMPTRRQAHLAGGPQVVGEHGAGHPHHHALGRRGGPPPGCAPCTCCPSPAQRTQRPRRTG